jgi:hypothetical protein
VWRGECVHRAVRVRVMLSGTHTHTREKEREKEREREDSAKGKLPPLPQKDVLLAFHSKRLLVVSPRCSSTHLFVAAHELLVVAVQRGVLRAAGLPAAAEELHAVECCTEATFVCVDAGEV